MSKTLRAKIRRDILHPLIDDRNADYEDIERYIDNLLEMIAKEVFDGYVELINSEEYLKKYAQSIHKEIEHFPEFRSGFITAMESAKETMISDKYFPN